MDNKILISELADGLCRRAIITHRDAEAFVTTAFDVISANLLTEKMVKVKGLGTFKLVDVDARESINVQTGERIRIASHSKVSFTPDASLRDLINQPFAEFETVVLNDGVLEDETGTSAPEDNEQPAPIDAQLPTEPTSPALPAENDKQTVSSTKRPLAVSSPQSTEPPAVVLEEGGDTDETDNNGQEYEDDLDDMPTVEPPTDIAPAPSEENNNPEPATTEMTKDVTSDPQPEQTKAQETPSESKLINIFSEEYMRQHHHRHRGHHSSHEHHHSHKQKRGWCCAVLSCIIGLLLLTVGYVLGCLYPMPLKEFIIEMNSPKPHEINVGVEDEPEEADSCDSLKQLKPQQGQKVVADTTKTTPAQTNQQPKVSPQKPTDNQKKYPQLEGGKYIICGQLATDTMKVGRTLLKISQKHYGSKDFVPYICTMNGIKNPDVVPLGMELKIPKLQPKAAKSPTPTRPKSK